MKFPDNPTNGQVYEASPGVYYEYSTPTKSWYRIVAPSIPLATHNAAGLMSADDYKKILGLIVPPPQIALSFEGCTTTYSNGYINLVGDDTGIITVEVKSSNLHENTAQINLGLDTQKLADKLIELGQLRMTAPVGDRGAQGETGDAGADHLPVGPQGPDGKDGANAAWPGSLTEESFNVVSQDRGIVDIGVEKVSPTENYIIVTRANIGNPDACPDTILPQDVVSPWVLGFSTPTAATQLVNQSGQTCGWACNSDLYYFDMDAVVQSIRTQFLAYLAKTKAAKEQLAQDWLSAMMTLFNEQKSALCCALEACRSRTRNQDARRYLEQQGIQAAQSNYSLLVGTEGDKEFPPLGPSGECKWDIASANYNPVHLSDPNCAVDWSQVCPVNYATPPVGQPTSGSVRESKLGASRAISSWDYSTTPPTAPDGTDPLPPGLYIERDTGLVAWFTFNDAANSYFLDSQNHNNILKAGEYSYTTINREALGVWPGLMLNGPKIPYVTPYEWPTVAPTYLPMGSDARSISVFMRQENVVESLALSGAAIWWGGSRRTMLRIVGPSSLESDTDTTYYGHVETFIGTEVGHEAAISRQPIDDNLWHHVAMTYDPASQFLTLYVDSLMVGRVQGIFTGGSDPDLDLFQIMGDKTSLADLRVYKRTLSSVEVSGLSKNRLWTKPSAALSLVQNGQSRNGVCAE